MNEAEPSVLAHHQPAAAMWNEGGRAYDDISFAISDALKHAAERLDARAGESVLDVATGTGWTARNVARSGASVVAVDIAADLLGAAESLSRHIVPPIRFELGDAERLPFDNNRFDAVISTFGVMFAIGQEQAARELGRVCRPGGRLVLTTWRPGGSVEAFFGIIQRYSDAPPPAVSPLRWGEPDAVADLLGGDFELMFESGTAHAYHPDPAAIWDWYSRGFGPLRQAIRALEPSRQAALRAEIDAFHAESAEEAGLHIRRDYLVTIGRRR